MKKPKNKLSNLDKELHKSLGVPAYEKQEMEANGDYKTKSKKKKDCNQCKQKTHIERGRFMPEAIKKFKFSNIIFNFLTK